MWVPSDGAKPERDAIDGDGGSQLNAYRKAQGQGGADERSFRTTMGCWGGHTVYLGGQFLGQQADRRKPPDG